MDTQISSRIVRTLRVAVLALFLLGAAWSVSAAPGRQTSPGLFVDAASPGSLDRSGDPTLVRARYVDIRFELLRGPHDTVLAERAAADTVRLNLFEDVAFDAVLNRVESSSPEDFIWIGTLQGIASSQVILAVKDKMMAGNVSLPGAFYQVRYAGGVHAIYEVDQARFPLEMDPIPVDTPEEQLDQAADSPQADPCTSVDVMVVYTPAARAAAGGVSAMETLIDLAVAETNVSYENSLIAQRLNLVYTAEVSYTEVDFSTDLSRLRYPSDGYMDHVHVLRDTYGADEVVLIVENTEYCGMAYLMTSVSDSFEALAFALVHRTCATGNYTFAHELGHNMGAHHDWYVNDDTRPYPYNHGYVNVQDRWLTIMSYRNECSDSGVYCTRLQYWSNPDVSYGGAPMGVPAGTSTSCIEGDLGHPPCDADNRLTLNNTACTVANFRESVVLSPGPLVRDHHVVDDDTSGASSGDGDSIADCGETIELSLDLYNQGGAAATGVQATLSTSSPYVTVLDGSWACSDIPGTTALRCSDKAVLAVHPSAPEGEIISFDLDITASNSGPWSDSFDALVTCGSTPVARWHLDEGSGLTAHDSVDGHDGALANTAWEPACVKNSCLAFAGVDSTVSVPDHADLSTLETLDLSFYLWLNEVYTEGRQEIAHKGSTAEDNYRVTFYPDDLNYSPDVRRRIVFRIEHGWEYESVTSMAHRLDAQVWYRVRAVYDGVSMRIYIDDVLSGEYAPLVELMPVLNDAPIIFGGGLSGRLDEIQLASIERPPESYTESHPIPAGDAPPVEFPSAGLTVDCSSGPGGTVTSTLYLLEHPRVPSGVNTAPRYWDVDSDFAGLYNCDLTFHYDESDLDGATESDIAGAARWDEDDVMWDYVGGAVDTGADTVTIENVTAFSDWLLLTSTPPDAVADLDGTRAGGDLLLAWPAVTQDIQGNAVTPDYYVVYRRADEPYFQPTAGDVIATPTTPPYTDPGVLGDPAHNYFYVVTAVDAGGAESAPSNRLGAFDFQLVPPAQAGERAYNLIALPLEMPAVVDADTLAAYAGAAVGGHGVYMVLCHDAATQGIKWRLPGLAGTNFAVEVGGVCYLYLDDTAPDVISLLGGVPAVGTVSYNLARPSPGGSCAYNFISVPLHRDDLVDADALAADIGGAYSVSRYNAATQDLTWRVPGLSGENFPVRVGHPYIVCLDETAPAVWP